MLVLTSNHDSSTDGVFFPQKLVHNRLVIVIAQRATNIIITIFLIGAILRISDPLFTYLTIRHTIALPLGPVAHLLDP